MHRQNLAKRCSAPPGQYSFHQPYQVEQQGQSKAQARQSQSTTTQTQSRLQALLRQSTAYNHPPSTHTPAPLALAASHSSARMSSPSRSPRSPHPLAHATPPLHQLGMLPPPPPATDIVDPAAQPRDDPSVDADVDAAGDRAPRPIYDFPSAVVMTEQIRTTRDTSSNRVLNQYLLGHRLGRGQHGDVYKGFDINRGYMVVAIKACRRKSKDRMEELRAKNAMERAAAAAASGASAQGGYAGEGRGLQRMGGGGGHLVDRLQSAERKVLREIAIMKKCKHGQIVQLLEVIDDRLTSKIFMVMEYMGGGEVKWRDSALSNALPVLRVDQARRICRDVILGLEYLHHQGIIHRDIKPANLLWTADRRGVKITDFGVSHFSYAQRLKAVRASEAYRRAVTKKKERLEREKEEKERLERVERERHWRFQGKGKGRVGSGSGSGSSSGRATPKMSAANLIREKEKAAGDEADDEDDADILEALEGTPDPLLLDDGGLSRQAGTPSFLAPEIIWEFRKERQDELVRRVGGLSGTSMNATAGTSVNPFGAGWFGGTRSRSGSEAVGVGGGDGDGEAGGEGSTNASLLATHPAHSHSPVRPGEARSRSASNPNPELGQEKALPALPVEQDDLARVPVGVNVIPPSESSRHGDEPTPPPRSPSPSPSSSAHDSPNSNRRMGTSTFNAVAPSSASAHTNGDPDRGSQMELDPSPTTTTLSNTTRPPITKAIDVWALGVTLYCLLFASCPWTGANEFVLYHAVHAQDFRVPETMGYDSIPSGPRGQSRAQAEESEGSFVVWLLERLLEKDVEKRISLDEVKRLPWITRDIPDPEAWLRETSPQRHDPINVTAADESDAMSVLKFTWKKRETSTTVVPGASSPRAAGASGLNRIARAGGRMIKNLLPGRQRSATPGRSLGTLEDAEESDMAVHTDAGSGGGWLRSKSRIDLLSGNRNKGKGKERERDDGEVLASSLRRTPSRKRRLAQATVEAVERVTRSGSMRSARSSRRRGKLPELKLSVRSEHTSHSRDSSLSRPGSRAQTPDPRQPTPLQMYSIPPYAAYPITDEPVSGGPQTPRVRAGSTSALTSPSTADLSSDDILDEDDERVLEERERERVEREAQRAAARERAEEDERVSRRSSIQKLWLFGRQRSSRSSLAEQNKKGKQRARAGTMGAASSGSGLSSEAGSRTFLTRGLARRSEDNMRMGRGPGQDAGTSSYAAATSSLGPRTGSGPALTGGMGMGMGLTVGMGFDADGPLTSGELTNAMRAQSWEGSGAAYATRPEDYDVMSDLDGQSVVYVDEDVRMVGAGGVLSNPGTVPGSPASQSHSRSGGSLSAQVQSHVDSLWLSDPVSPAYGHGHGHGPPIPLIHPQGDHLLHPLNVPAIADPALQDPTGFAAARAGGYQISSPLAQTPLNNYDESPSLGPFDEHYIRARRVEQILQGETRSPSRDSRRQRRSEDPGYVHYGDEDENSSFESGERVYGQGQTTLQDDIEDSGSEEAEEAIVVRRRRPSESLARSRSQIRRDEE